MRVRRLFVALSLVGASLAIAAPAQAEPLCKYRVCEQVWLITCGLQPGGCI